MAGDTVQHCSFCGKHITEVRWSYPGPSVRICGECVALCVELMAKGKAHWRPAIDADINPASEKIIEANT